MRRIRARDPGLTLFREQASQEDLGPIGTIRKRTAAMYNGPSRDKDEEN